MNDMILDRWATKAVHPDFTTRGGFRWAFPGGWTEDPDAEGVTPSEYVCPQGPGDGLSVAKTVRGMAAGSYSPVTVLVVGFNHSDVIAEDADKIKVKRAYTLEVWDGIRLLRDNGAGATLTGANLTGADLTGANLAGANLYGVRWDETTVWPEGFDKDRLT